MSTCEQCGGELASMCRAGTVNLVGELAALRARAEKAEATIAARETEGWCASCRDMRESAEAAEKRAADLEALAEELLGWLRESEHVEEWERQLRALAAPAVVSSGG